MTWSATFATAGAFASDSPEFVGMTEHMGHLDDERRAALSGTILADLGGLGRLRISGRDHRTFLQAQFTSDIGTLEPGHAQPSAWLTPKGQVLTVCTLVATDDAIDVYLPVDQAEAIAKRLAMFVFRSKVTIENLSGDQGLLGLAGTQTDALLASDHRCAVVPLPGVRTRYWLTGDNDALDDFARAVTSPSATDRPTLVGRDAWHLSSCDVAWPELTSPVRERFIPQMLSLDLLGAVGFDKGCYPGQEIVARTQYLGRIKRRLHRLRGTGAPPAPLSTVTADGSKQGDVVTSAATGDDTFVALAVVNIERPPSSLLIGDIETVSDMPYGAETTTGGHDKAI